MTTSNDQPEVGSVMMFSQTNIILLVVFLYVMYLWIFKRPRQVKAAAPREPIVIQDFDKKKLEKYNGVDDPRIFMGKLARLSYHIMLTDDVFINYSCKRCCI